MRINDEMAAEARFGGGGWQCEGEDGVGGIAPRLPVREDVEVPIFGYPRRPRHAYFSSRPAADERPRSRSPQSAERARQARILRRRNGR